MRLKKPRAFLFAQYIACVNAYFLCKTHTFSKSNLHLHVFRESVVVVLPTNIKYNYFMLNYTFFGFMHKFGVPKL